MWMTLSIESWVNALENKLRTPNGMQLNQFMARYGKSVIAQRYLELFNDIIGEKI